MSLKTEGVTCVRCHAYLFDDDDIVYCPVCGAPHHRDCYNELGHCALEEFHGTDKQYDKIKAAEETVSAREATCPPFSPIAGCLQLLLSCRSLSPNRTAWSTAR